jgi:hypothetical protein
MDTIKVDTSNPDLFKPPEFPILPAGIHTFAVSELSDFESAKEGMNLVCKLEATCQDEEPAENKGVKVFENFVLITEPSTSKQVTAKKLNEQRMAQFCLACGVTTKDQIEATGELPIKACSGQFFKAQTGTRLDKYHKEQTGETRQQSYIKKYLFEDSEEATE